jgi:transcriptional regulator with XRE-family HTH domain
MTTEPSLSFGEHLRLWRFAHNLSQTAFGQRLHPEVHPATVSNWESGTRFPSKKYLGQIVALTGIPVHLALGIPATAGPEPTHGN